MKMLTAAFNNVDSKVQSSTDKRVFCYHQSNVQQLLPSSDYCRAHGNQIVEHSSDNETMFNSSQQLGGIAEHLIGGSKKRICWLMP